MKGICPICRNVATEGSQFCKLHHRARVQMESAFDKWQLAYSNQVSKRAFLERVLLLPGTGQRVREVIHFILENDLH